MQKPMLTRLPRHWLGESFYEAIAKMPLSRRHTSVKSVTTMMQYLQQRWIEISILLFMEIAIEAVLNIEIPDVLKTRDLTIDPWIKIECVI